MENKNQFLKFHNNINTNIDTNIAIDINNNKIEENEYDGQSLLKSKTNYSYNEKGDFVSSESEIEELLNQKNLPRKPPWRTNI